MEKNNWLWFVLTPTNDFHVIEKFNPTPCQFFFSNLAKQESWHISGSAIDVSQEM